MNETTEITTPLSLEQEKTRKNRNAKNSSMRSNSSNQSNLIVITPIDENDIEVDADKSEKNSKQNTEIASSSNTSSTSDSSNPKSVTTTDSASQKQLSDNKNIQSNILLTITHDGLDSLITQLNSHLTSIINLNDNEKKLKLLTIRFYMLHIYNELENWHSSQQTEERNQDTLGLIKNNFDINQFPDEKLLEFANEIIAWNKTNQHFIDPELRLCRQIKGSGTHLNATISWRDSRHILFQDYRQSEVYKQLLNIQKHFIQLHALQSYSNNSLCKTDLQEAKIFCIYQIGLAYSLCPYLQAQFHSNDNLKHLLKIVDALWDKTSRTVYPVSHFRSEDKTHEVDTLINKLFKSNFYNHVQSELNNLPIPHHYDVCNQFFYVNY